jgi:hypothetical protein
MDALKNSVGASLHEMRLAPNSTMQQMIVASLESVVVNSPKHSPS